MATLLKGAHSGRRALVHRSVLSPALSRGAKRTLPTTPPVVHAPVSRSVPRHRSLHCPHGSRADRGRNPASHLLLRNEHFYSTTRTLRRPPGDKSNLPSKPSSPSSSSSSSSFLDRVRNTAASALESSRAAAEHTTKTVATRASSAVRESAKKATEKAQRAASETLEGTQRAARKAGEKAVKRVSDTASAAKREGSRRLSEGAAGVSRAAGEAISSRMGRAGQKLSEGASGLRNSTGETIARSTRAIGSGVEEQRRAAAAKAEEISESTKQLKESVAVTGKKALSWFWWWSLAAVFVYGVASTLPMAIIKYTMEEKRKKWRERPSETNDEGGEGSGQDAHRTDRSQHIQEEPSINAVGWDTFFGASDQSESKKD